MQIAQNTAGRGYANQAKIFTEKSMDDFAILKFLRKQI